MSRKSVYLFLGFFSLVLGQGSGGAGLLAQDLPQPREPYIEPVTKVEPPSIETNQAAAAHAYEDARLRRGKMHALVFAPADAANAHLLA